MKPTKILLTSVLICWLLLGCQSLINTGYFEIEDKENKLMLNQENEDIIYESFSGDLAYALDNPQGLRQAIDEIIDYVAIVRIDSVNYSNWNPMSKQYDLPFTHGEATVIENLKGLLPTTQIKYRRFGGTLPYEEYIKGSRAPEKVARLQRENNVDVSSLKGTMVVSKWDGDIEVEVGKVYLVLMVQESEDNYWFEGYQYGLREVQSTGGSVLDKDSNTLQVKNNETGEWEELSSIGLNLGQ